MKKVFKYILILLIANVGHAATLCKSYDFLKNGFNITNYKKCEALIHQCKAIGPLPDAACVEQTVIKHSVCSQLNQLSQVTAGIVSALTVESSGNFIIIEQNFPADGQQNYYLLSAHGCFMNTTIDPRTLSPTLAKKYK